MYICILRLVDHDPVGLHPGLQRRWAGVRDDLGGLNIGRREGSSMNMIESDIRSNQI